MIGGLLLMGGLGVLCGIGLAMASKIFYVYVDPKVEAVADVFAGANCGGCGFAGCSAAAAAGGIGKGKTHAGAAGMRTRLQRPRGLRSGLSIRRDRHGASGLPRGGGGKMRGLRRVRAGL